MDKDKRQIEEEAGLDEADRLIERLYEQSQETVPWDESDDAILSFAKEVAAEKRGDLQGGAEDAADVSSDESEDAGGGNVVAFRPRPRQTTKPSIMRSPFVGFAVAASLMVGMFAGQGLTPYVNLGLGPDYKGLIAQNQELTRSLAATREGREIEPTIEPLQLPDAGKADLGALQELLGAFPCANLTLSIANRGAATLSGRLATAEDQRALEAALSDFSGLGEIRNETALLPAGAWPICGALEVLETQTHRGAGNGGPKALPHQHGMDYRDGEKLVVEVTAPDQDSYLYVDFVMNDGTVLHLLPAPDHAGNLVTAGKSMHLGDSGTDYRIAGPFGREVLMIVAAPEPLFNAPRPEAESAASYFRDLEAALARQAEKGLGDRLLSSYEILTTHPK